MEKPHRFVDDSCQKLDIVKDVLVYFEKYVNAYVFNNLSLLDRYGWLKSQHNLGYPQFADINNKWSFHNSNFDKNFVRYCS